MRKRTRHGFTLIELLVVISIIAVLISLLLPALAWARFQANITVCAANLHQIGIGMANYASQNHGYLSPPRAGGSPDNVWTGTPGADPIRAWATDIAGTNSAHLFCPIGIYRPEHRGPIDPSDPYSRMFLYWKQSASVATYTIGYSVFANLVDGGSVYDWTDSGNTAIDGPPSRMEVVTAHDVLASDIVWTWVVGPDDDFGLFTHAGPPGWNNFRQYYTGHNVLAGDLHVEQRAELENWVLRTNGLIWIHY